MSSKRNAESSPPAGGKGREEGSGTSMREGLRPSLNPPQVLRCNCRPVGEVIDVGHMCRNGSPQTLEIIYRAADKTYFPHLTDGISRQGSDR